MRWKRVARDQILAGRVFEVVRDTLRITEGSETRETAFDVVRHPGAAAILPLHADGTVSLLCQYRYAIDERIWEIPAGSLDGDETFRACAERELEEEVGLRAERWTELARFYPSPGFCDEELRVFLAESLAPGSTNRDPDEDFEVARVPLSDAIAWSRNGRIRDAKSMIALSAIADRSGSIEAGGA